ncbi:hypothetical protein [Azospirillum doebereinerae]|uniref:Uncharacterized protein n=1 Tax=Azospirillum doebereinerae TaxID=92933 RepID=A0A3S0WMF1_9PROT|nr:hypothetical protein [Azospirillum doebereinerae]MCG5238783.1 hypothetical protein [Azospirillum doebereinerae]RUQ72095.1 hypothetical protein EJ913_11060 [Azospirillum doebereinerae]
MAKRQEKGKIPHTEWPEIRTRYAAGESLASIARTYGCTGPAIRYIVNRPTQADGASDVTPPAPPPASPAVEPPETARRADATGGGPATKTETPAAAQADRPHSVPGDRAGTVSIDADLRWRVSSEIASFLTVFDSFLMESSSESYDDLLGATDRLMRVAARIRIELERSRTSHQRVEPEPPPRPSVRRARSRVT